MIAAEDRDAVIAAIGTFRMGAPILVDDVRVAAAADGHPIRHMDKFAISECMKERCDLKVGRYGPKDYHYWFRRW